MRETWAGRLPVELRPENDEQCEQRIDKATDFYSNLFDGEQRTGDVVAETVIGFVSQVALRRFGLEIADLLEARARAFLRFAETHREYRADAQAVAEAVRHGHLTYYFGAPWDDGRLTFGAVHVPLPVQHECFQCDDVIVPGDRGFIVPVMVETGITTAPLHMECDLRARAGHALGVCSCTGYGHDRRARAAILDAVNRHRAEMGHEPI